MPVPIQLEFFREIDELEEIRMQMKALKDSQDKVRKKLFAEHGKMAKMYIELYQEFEHWKSVVSKSKEKIELKFSLDKE